MRVHIKQYRLEKGLTQVQLSRLIPCNPGTLSLIERGRQAVTTTRLERIGQILNVHPHLLVTYTVDEEPT